jgi:hypothetical protein
LTLVPESDDIDAFVGGAFSHHPAVLARIHDQRIVILILVLSPSPFFFVLLKDEGMIPDADDVSVFQPVGVDQLLVDKRAIFALEIDQHETLAQAIDLGMVAGNRRIIDHNAIVCPSTNSQGVAPL